MLLSMLIFVAVILTAIMFIVKEMMLGFPCVIFWAIAAGQAYTLSTATWDIEYFIFFGCIGMSIFSAVAMYGLREKRDSIGDQDMEQGEGNYIDEQDKQESESKIASEIDTDNPDSNKSKRLSGIRQRAKERRQRRSNFINITR